MSCVLKELLDKDPDRPVFSLFLKRFEHKQPQCIDRKKILQGKMPLPC